MLDQTPDTYIVFFPIRGLYLIAPILSTVSTFLVVIYCIYTKKYKQPLGLMVILINAADFWFCLTKLVFSINPDWYSEANCEIFDAISHFGLISSVFWGAAFGHALFYVVGTQVVGMLEKKIKIYSLMAVVIPLLFSLQILWVPYVTFSDEKCVHPTKDPDFRLSYIFLALIPIAGSGILSLRWYCKVYKELKSLEIEGSLLTLIAYPGIVIICWFPVLFTRIAVMFGTNLSSVVNLLNLFDSLGQLQGFFDAVVYGIGLHKVCFCFKKRRTDTSEELPSIKEEVSLQSSR